MYQNVFIFTDPHIPNAFIKPHFEHVPIQKDVEQDWRYGRKLQKKWKTDYQERCEALGVQPSTICTTIQSKPPLKHWK